MKSDEAVSEVLGFVLVLGLVIILVSLVTAAALPNLIKESEIEDNEKALSSFEGIKKDMDTFCLAEVSGMKKQAIIDTSDKVRLSVSYGKKVGDRFRGAADGRLDDRRDPRRHRRQRPQGRYDR